MWWKNFHFGSYQNDLPVVPPYLQVTTQTGNCAGHENSTRKTLVKYKTDIINYNLFIKASSTRLPMNHICFFCKKRRSEIVHFTWLTEPSNHVLRCYAFPRSFSKCFLWNVRSDMSHVIGVNRLNRNHKSAASHIFTRHMLL